MIIKNYYDLCKVNDLFAVTKDKMEYGKVLIFQEMENKFMKAEKMCENKKGVWYVLTSESKFIRVHHIS